MALDPHSPLQRSVFTNGRGFSYFARTPGLPLSLKCMSNGRALYRIDRADIAVDDAGYLILNDGQPYSIEIASPTEVETFVLWFKREWVQEVALCLTEGAETLLDNGAAERSRPAHFFERYTAHDRTVTPRVLRLRAALKSKELIEDSWLEEQLRDLLAAMCATQHTVRRDIAHLPAVRPATREELWRRINRARDYLHAHLGSSIRLSDVATAACLSPFHLLRVFDAAFGETPHHYLRRCRLERAKFLLEKTRIRTSDICLECGFSSLGSFSALFHKSCGLSPRAWRKSRGAAAGENSKIREVYLRGAR